LERAIVLVNIAPGGEEDVMRDLRNEKSVLEVYQLYGLYDLLAVVEGVDDQAVKSLISVKLRGHPRVSSTLTMKVVES
jgi:DNA-binding Lrp family transcriptional regulator